MILRLIGIILGSACMILSFPNWNSASFIFLAFVPLFWVLEKNTPKQNFMDGWLFGFLAHLGIFFWVLKLLLSNQVPLFLSVLAWFLLAGYLGCYQGFFAYLSGKILKADKHTLSIILIPVIWVSLEWIQSWLWTGFPWCLLGYSLSQYPKFLQIAEYTGIYGVSFEILFWNIGLFIFLRKKHLNFIWVGGLFLLFIANFYLMGLAEKKLAIVQQNIPKTCVLLQPNIAQTQKWNPNYSRKILAEYERFFDRAPKERIGKTIYLWPESALPFSFSDPMMPKWLKQQIQKTGCQHLVGMDEVISGADYYNALGLFDGEGKRIQTYRKIHLVPFGEYVPFRLLLQDFFTVLNQLGNFSEGETHQLPLQTQVGKAGVTICYEGIFPNLSAQQSRSGAEFLVNISNDAWFESSACHQHWQMNRLRAVENRKYLLRAGNTGISGVVDPLGRIVSESKLNEVEHLRVSFWTSSFQTFYSLHGDVFAYFCVIFSVIFLSSLALKTKFRRFLNAL